MTNPIVFISYSHDSPEHVDRVRAFANQLRRDGIDCTLDQYKESPPEGWPEWTDRHIAKSDFQVSMREKVPCISVLIRVPFLSSLRLA
jgi:hypothetical protein